MPGTYYVRVGGYNGASGSFQLDVNGPTFVPAASVPYGAGCYRLSKAFYEEFPAGVFDLASSGMRLAYDAAGSARRKFKHRSRTTRDPSPTSCPLRATPS
ncbi:MAG: hypothetical protein ACK53T_11210, partial [Planctomycetota bacterium]